jgi:hypothetical protein
MTEMKQHVLALLSTRDVLTTPSELSLGESFVSGVPSNNQMLTFSLGDSLVGLRLIGVEERTTDAELLGNVFGITPMSVDKLGLPLHPSQRATHVYAIEISHTRLGTSNKMCVGGGSPDVLGLTDGFLTQQVAQCRRELLYKEEMFSMCCS